MSQDEMVIPEGWKKVTVEECISNILGGDWGDNDLESIPKGYVRVKILRATEMSNWLQQKGKTGVTRIIKKSSLEKRQLKPNDLILEISGGSTKFTVGRCVLIDEEVLQGDLPVICSNFFRKITLNKDVDPKFIHYFLHNFHATQKMVQYISKSTNIQNLKVPQLLSHTFIMPSIPIQKQIVAKLDHILRELEVKKKEILSLIEQNKQRIDFFEKNWINYIISTLILRKKLPKGWLLIPLSEICNVERGKFGHRPRNDPAFYGGKYPFIQTGDVARSNGRVSKFSQTLNEKGLKVSRMFPKGTVVITIAANIGDTAILEFDSCFPDSLIGITPFPEKTIAEYVEYALRLYQKDLTRDASQGAQKNINYDFLKPLLIPIPKTIAEQENIVRKIKSAEEKFQSQKKQFENIKNNYESKINYINHIQSSILDSAFSGKLIQ